MEHECDGDTNYKWGARNDPKRLLKKLQDFEIRG